MPRRLVLFALFAIVGMAGPAAAIAAPVGLAAHAQAAQQTSPRVRPRVGRRHSTFHLTFTLVQAPIRSGLETTEYRAVITQPSSAPASCSPPQPAPIVSGAQGSRVRIALRPSAHGWCRGRYAVTVLLERTEACGPMGMPNPMMCCGPPMAEVESSRPAICPVAADAARAFPIALDTGTAYFRVR